jgi:hypothetical protein
MAQINTDSIILSKKFATARLFKVNKSARLLHFLVIIHALAGVACLTNALPFLYKILLLVTVGASFFLNLRRYHIQFQPYQLKYHQDSGWSIAIENDNFQTLEILPSTVITIWLIALHFRLENGKSQSLLIVNDALSQQSYRALVVTLKVTH